MGKNYNEGKRYEKLDCSARAWPEGEYEQCAFLGCDFSSADLSGSTFSECTFEDCNLSLAKLGNTSLRDVRFKSCKLLGLHFENCSAFLFAVGFEDCILNLSSFYKLKLKKAVFRRSSLQETDFTGADLSGAVFDDCHLAKAAFSGSILEKADFRTAYHYSIDPEKNQVKKAKFSAMGIIGLLDKYDIVVE